jgi:hypothetical protein
MTSTTDRLVHHYLTALESAAAGLSPDARRDLVTDIRDHLNQALGSPPYDEISVRTVLDRLGDPEEIVAAAGARAPAPTGPRLRVRDAAGLALLPFGALAFGVGWLVGVVLLWTSDRWTTREKLLGTLVWPGGVLAPVYGPLLLGVDGQRCSAGESIGPDGTVVTTHEVCEGFALPQVVGVPLLVVLVAAPVAVVLLLASRAAPGRG